MSCNCCPSVSTNDKYEVKNLQQGVTRLTCKVDDMEKYMSDLECRMSNMKGQLQCPDFKKKCLPKLPCVPCPPSSCAPFPPRCPPFYPQYSSSWHVPCGSPPSCGQSVCQSCQSKPLSCGTSCQPVCAMEVKLREELMECCNQARQLKQDKCFAETRVEQLEKEVRRLEERELRLRCLEEERLSLQEQIRKLKVIEAERDCLKEKIDGMSHLKDVYSDFQDMAKKYAAMKAEKDALECKVRACCTLEAEVQKLRVKENEAEMLHCETKALQLELDKVMAEKREFEDELKRAETISNELSDKLNQYTMLGDPQILKCKMRRLIALEQECDCLRKKCQSCRCD